MSTSGFEAMYIGGSGLTHPLPFVPVVSLLGLAYTDNGTLLNVIHVPCSLFL